LIDEEHSRLQGFKYQGVLAALPVSAYIRVSGTAKKPQYSVFDDISKQEIVRINGKPAIDYLNHLLKQFNNKSHVGV
jgi:hypothetical protein